MNDTDALTPLAAARAMLDIFASVGAGHFHVTWTNSEAQPRRARSLRQSLAALGGPLPHADNPDWLDAIHIARISAADLNSAMPALLETAFADRLNLNVRPYTEAVRFIQLDDIPPDALLRASAAMFLQMALSGCQQTGVNGRNRRLWRLCCRRNFADVAPCAKGGIASRTILVGTEVMAAKLEVVMDPAVSGKKALRMTR